VHDEGAESRELGKLRELRELREKKHLSMSLSTDN
jgi:hypothetical protein